MPPIGTGFAEILAGLAQAALLAWYAWWAPLLIAGAWASTHLLLRDSSVWKVFGSDPVVSEQRHAHYAFRLAVDAPAAKEIRLFGLAGWMVGRVAELRRRVADVILREQRLRRGPLLLGVAVLLGANGLLFWSLARDANLEDYPPVTILHAVAARIALHKADRPRAIAELTMAQRLRPGLTYALPHLAVQARIELARCHLALSDFAAARILLREVTEVLTRRPGLGVFVGQAEDLRAELSRTRGSFAPGASALTAAELRLLPMLLTHLSFPEIAGEMFLSPNTVKSEAMSIYRKLGASSRSQAVTRSRELGLLEG